MRTNGPKLGQNHLLMPHFLKYTIVMLMSILVMPLQQMHAQENHQRRFALIIGNSDYQEDPLLTPRSDCQLIKGALEEVGFDITIHYNLSQSNEFLGVLRDFEDKTDSADIVLIYYAGHGIAVNGKNYLLPTDQQFNSERDVEYFGVSTDNILRGFESKENRANILILDACRNNPFESNWRRQRGEHGEGLAKEIAPFGSIVAYSTSYGSTASDGSETNSPFAKSLANNIVFPNISIERVFAKTREDVRDYTQERQIPTEESKLLGDPIVLRRIAGINEVTPDNIQTMLDTSTSGQGHIYQVAFSLYNKSDSSFNRLAATFIQTELDKGSFYQELLEYHLETPIRFARKSSLLFQPDFLEGKGETGLSGYFRHLSTLGIVNFLLLHHNRLNYDNLVDLTYTILSGVYYTDCVYVHHDFGYWGSNGQFYDHQTYSASRIKASETYSAHLIDALSHLLPQIANKGKQQALSFKESFLLAAPYIWHERKLSPNLEPLCDSFYTSRSAHGSLNHKTQIGLSDLKRKLMQGSDVLSLLDQAESKAKSSDELMLSSICYSEPNIENTLRYMQAIVSRYCIRQCGSLSSAQGFDEIQSLTFWRRHLEIMKYFAGSDSFHFFDSHILFYLNQTIQANNFFHNNAGPYEDMFEQYLTVGEKHIEKCENLSYGELYLANQRFENDYWNTNIYDLTSGDGKESASEFMWSYNAFPPNPDAVVEHAVQGMIHEIDLFRRMGLLMSNSSASSTIDDQCPSNWAKFTNYYAANEMLTLILEEQLKSDSLYGSWYNSELKHLFVDLLLSRGQIDFQTMARRHDLSLTWTIMDALSNDNSLRQSSKFQLDYLELLILMSSYNDAKIDTNYFVDRDNQIELIRGSFSPEERDRFERLLLISERLSN